MRRVVTAVNNSGQSYIASDESIPDRSRIWTTDPATFRSWAEAVEESAIYRAAQPAPGAAIFQAAVIPPNTENVGVTHEAGAEQIDEDGFHIHRTVDFIYLVEGTLTLTLDLDEVELSAGDCVVLQVARHAWRNRTDQPVRFIASVVSAEKE